MSPKAMLMMGAALADMPWHVPTTMGAILESVTLCCDAKVVIFLLTASERADFFTLFI